MVMFAEVSKDGQWHKVGKEFISTYKEIEGQLTDRVFDGNNKFLEEFLLKNNFYTSGLPSNVSEEIKNHKNFQDIAHCVTLKCLLELDWNQEVCETGFISEWQYKRLKESGIQPVHIIKSPSTKGRNVVLPFMMDMIIKHPSLREDGISYYVKHEYNKRAIIELCDFFCNVSIPGLIKLIPEGGTTGDVRIIFST